MTLEGASALCEDAIKRKRLERLSGRNLAARKCTPGGARATAAEAAHLSLLEQQRAMTEEIIQRNDPRGRRLARLNRAYNPPRRDRVATRNINNSSRLAQVIQEESETNSSETEVEERRLARRPRATASRSDKGLNNRVKLPVFSNEDGTDGVSYRIWRHDAMVNLNQGVSDAVLLRAMLESLKGLPGEVARTVSPAEGPMGVIEALDVKYRNAKDGPALLKTFFSLEQGDDESPASWAGKLEILMRELKLIDPLVFGNGFGDGLLRHQYATSASRKYRSVLKMRLDEPDTFDDLQRKARAMEAEDIPARSLLPPSEKTASRPPSDRHPKGQTFKKGTSVFKPHYVKKTSVEPESEAEIEETTEEMDYTDPEVVRENFWLMMSRVAGDSEDMTGRCYRCGSDQHRWRECPELKKGLNPTGGAQKKSSTSAPPKKTTTTSA